MSPSAQLRIYNKRIQNAIFQEQKSAAKDLIQIVIDAIKLRVRKANQLASGATIPENKDSTVKYRERYSSNLSSDTSPGESNATATGQLLDSMKGKASGTKIKIELKDKRSRELSGSKSKLTNSQVNFWYEKLKGEWFALSKDEGEEVFDYVKERIRKAIIKVSK